MPALSLSKGSEIVEEVRIPSTTQAETESTITKGLITTNPYNIKYTTDEVEYRIKGFKTDQLDSLKASIQIVNLTLFSVFTNICRLLLLSETGYDHIELFLVLVAKGMCSVFWWTPNYFFALPTL